MHLQALGGAKKARGCDSGAGEADPSASRIALLAYLEKLESGSLRFGDDVDLEAAVRAAIAPYGALVKAQTLHL